MTFNELFKVNGVAKYGQGKLGHHYFPVYELLFQPVQNDPINVFEVGYCDGVSAKLWLDYFPNAKVKCVDINPLWGDPDNPWGLKDDRFTFECLDSNNLTPGYFGRSVDRPDIFIDDGSHLLSDQLHVVRVVYPILKPGGLLIIEDVQDIDRDKVSFEQLGFPFVVADMRPPGSKTDDVLIIYRK